MVLQIFSVKIDRIKAAIKAKRNSLPGANKGVLIFLKETVSRKRLAIITPVRSPLPIERSKRLFSMTPIIIKAEDQIALVANLFSFFQKYHASKSTKPARLKEIQWIVIHV